MKTIICALERLAFHGGLEYCENDKYPVEIELPRSYFFSGLNGDDNFEEFL